ncbi:MAG: cytochrome c oxidase assembly protein [Dehalococcoidia bacterium]|nr:cytochrome c oxidase assembly protein [Dehalococcoidia bacterium]
MPTAWPSAARACLGRRNRHGRGRAVAFYLGLAALWLAVLGPVEHYGNRLISVNFLGVLLITMVAAPLLVFSSPITLAFRRLGLQGSRRLRYAIRNPVAAAITFPAVTWLLFAVVTYIWQFTDLTVLAAKNPFVRDVQLASLLLVGLLFWYPALASDPIRWRLGYPLRGLYVLLESTHKSLFGGFFLSMNTAFHDYFAANTPAWALSAMEDQRLGILLLWIGGNAVFLAILIAIITRWMQYEARNSHRVDRRLAREREERRRREAALEQVFDKRISARCHRRSPRRRVLVYPATPA